MTTSGIAPSDGPFTATRTADQAGTLHAKARRMADDRLRNFPVPLSNKAPATANPIAMLAIDVIGEDRRCSDDELRATVRSHMRLNKNTPAIAPRFAPNRKRRGDGGNAGCRLLELCTEVNEEFVAI